VIAATPAHALAVARPVSLSLPMSVSDGPVARSRPTMAHVDRLFQ
jgi:hypothetical protein